MMEFLFCVFVVLKLVLHLILRGIKKEGTQHIRAYNRKAHLFSQYELIEHFPQNNKGLINRQNTRPCSQRERRDESFLQSLSGSRLP